MLVELKPNYLFLITVSPIQSGESLRDSTASSATHFRNVLSSQTVLVLDLYLVDLVRTNVLALQRVHEIDLH